MTALENFVHFICEQQNPQRSSGKSGGVAGFHPLEKEKGVIWHSHWTLASLFCAEVFVV